jgi:hypothetical protein
LKIADLYFLALSPTSLNNFKRYRRRRKKFLSAVGDGGKKFLSAVGDIVYNFLPPSPTALKN